jgi:K+-sensing histidine kinase KdpD
MAQISVRDTGPGIPVECLDKIFDPFFRIQQRQRSGPKGLGLGLSIVKTLVELQGGVVVAKNRPQGGLDVSFTRLCGLQRCTPGLQESIATSSLSMMTPIFDNS